MDNNSRAHGTHLVSAFLQDDDITRLEWTACYPDMTPIERAWDTLKRTAFRRGDPPTNLRGICRIAFEE